MRFADSALSIDLATHCFICLPTSRVSFRTRATNPSKKNGYEVLIFMQASYLPVYLQIFIYPSSIEIGYYGAKDLAFSLPRQLALI